MPLNKSSPWVRLTTKLYHGISAKSHLPSNLCFVYCFFPIQLKIFLSFRHLRTHNRYEHQDSSSIDDSAMSSRLSASTESESMSRDLSDIRISRDFSEGQFSFEVSENRLSRDFSESRLSRDFSENQLSFDLSENRFLGDNNDRFSNQSSRDFEDNQQIVENRQSCDISLDNQHRT